MPQPLPSLVFHIGGTIYLYPGCKSYYLNYLSRVLPDPYDDYHEVLTLVSCGAGAVIPHRG